MSDFGSHPNFEKKISSGIILLSDEDLMVVFVASVNLTNFPNINKLKVCPPPPPRNLLIYIQVQ
jgi:hypothetical protein